MKKEDNKKPSYFDKEKYSLAERKDIYKAEIDSMMNPFPSFNPETFEPNGDDYKEVADRAREKPVKLLPTFGLNPKKIREGQMIGMFESKQDLYLTLAHRINEMQAEIDLLKINKK